jgi:transcriptional activator of cad operon
MTPSPATPLQIGDWRLDPAASQMTRGAETAQLEARTLRLLLHLASKPGELVGIEELLDQVWPGVTVTQDSVYQAVAALRRQLGDDPRNPRYIATAPRLGYRMIAAVGPASGRVDKVAPKKRLAWAFLPAGVVVFAGAALALGLPRVEPPVAGTLGAVAVGVMPFADMTDAMDQEVFVDNLTEDVIDRLSRSQGLRTPGPRSSFALKGAGLAPPQAAARLGVDYVLDGSIRSAPGAMQVTARLIRADTGFVIWSRTYKAPPATLETIQQSIVDEAARVARAGA